MVALFYHVFAIGSKFFPRPPPPPPPPPPYACAAVKAVQAKKRKAKGKAGKRPPDALKAKEKRWVGSIWNPNTVFICTVHSEEFGHG